MKKLFPYVGVILGTMLVVGTGCTRSDLFQTVAAKISDARLLSFSNESPVHSFAGLLPEDCQKGERYDVTAKACNLVCASEDCAAKESAAAAKGAAIWKKYITADRDNDDFDIDESSVIATYDADDGKLKNFQKEDVPANLKVWQKDKTRLARPWKLFTTLFPKGAYDIIDSYSIYTDGSAKSAASLEPGDSSQGTYTLHVDIVDAFPKNKFDADSLAYFFIHEFGHVLTLNQNEQAGYDDSESDEDECPTYEAATGCLRTASYLNRFYERFWASTWNDFRALGQDGYDAALKQEENQWHAQHHDWFVTEYAATLPEEDIAESWSAFVLKEKPTGAAIADQKILFFYEYPELVNMRDAIRHRLVAASAV